MKAQDAKGHVDYSRCANTDVGHGFLDIWTLRSRSDVISTNKYVQTPLVQDALDQEVRANQVKSVNLILPSRCETCWIFQIEDWLSFHVVFCLKTRWWIPGPPKLAVFWPAACHANNPLPCSPKAVVLLHNLNTFSNESPSQTAGAKLILTIWPLIE